MYAKVKLRLVNLPSMKKKADSGDVTFTHPETEGGGGRGMPPPPPIS
jgi:hypothetical protein